MSGFILAPTKVGLPTLSSEAQEVLNALVKAGYRMHLIQQPTTILELYRALDQAPFSLGWVGTHSGEKGFDLGSEILTPLDMGRFLYEAETEDLVLNACFSVQHVQMIQSRAPVNIVATIDPNGVDEATAWSTALFLVRALARTGSLEQAYLETISGGLTQYQWFPYLGRATVMSTARLQRDRPSERFIEDVLREKLTEHDQKLLQLETKGIVQKEYVDELRADVKEIKQELKPLSGLQVRSQSATEEHRGSVSLLMRLLIGIGSILLILVLGVTGLALFLVLRSLGGV